MSKLQTLIRILIISGGLALYEIFLRDAYKNLLAIQGKTYGFGESFLGYLTVLVSSYVLAMALAKKLRRGGGWKRHGHDEDEWEEE